MQVFKDANGHWSWTRIRGCITLAFGGTLAWTIMRARPLTKWDVILILGLCIPEMVVKLLQKDKE